MAVAFARGNPLIRNARTYSQWRRRPPTVAQLLLKPPFFRMPLVGGVGVALLVALGLPIAWPMFLLGIVVGAVCRDLGYAIRAIRYWPATSQLLDWKKIEEIVVAEASAEPILDQPK